MGLSGRLQRRTVAQAALAGVLVALVVIEVRPAAVFAASVVPMGDFVVLRDATASWLAGEPYYPAFQLAGPFQVGPANILYPPPALLLFVPFTVLPAFLWWAIPLGVVVGWIAWCRPRPLALLGITACFLSPKTVPLIIVGNPTMWLTAALALSVRWGWPAALLVFKPTVAPLALIGVRHRSWWIALAVSAAVSLAFLPMWADWIAVMMNARHPLGALYSLPDVPMMLIPIVAWIGRTNASAFPDKGETAEARLARVTASQL